MHELANRAAAPMSAIVRAIREDQLGAPTPCQEWDVRGLVDHLLMWGPPLIGAAHKKTVPPAEGDGPWRERLLAQIDQLAKAWSEPAAWDGTAHVGGPTPLPAATVGGMALGELVVHGWDLARATGQHPSWDEDVLAFVYKEVERTAEQGRAMSVYADPVPVPANAPTLDRLLALTGRTPS
jgi:uncharacterized protein (TIGR03086 family)